MGVNHHYFTFDTRKDFSGVVIHEFDNEIAVTSNLKKQQNVNVLFSDIFEVKVDSKCEEKK